MSASSAGNTNIHEQRILILDFGSQYTQLIARRVREAGVYCEIHHYGMTQQEFAGFAPDGVILSGGPESISFEDSPRVPDYVFSAKVPVLGICYGLQAMAVQLGGQVQSSSHSEFGHARIEVCAENALLSNLK
ncbi:MAG: gamma-glutamyl-gamma-aminobutyrate hydrolase family protein, partial [Haliea sp.]